MYKLQKKQLSTKFLISYTEQTRKQITEQEEKPECNKMQTRTKQKQNKMQTRMQITKDI